VDHDPRKLIEHYRRLQKRHQERLVSRSPPKPEKEGEDAA
jgi:hypothetical protein